MSRENARPGDYTIPVFNEWGFAMSMMGSAPPGETDKHERMPVMQRVLDNPFLLLFLGVTIPTVLYILWGVMEIASIPLAK